MRKKNQTRAKENSKFEWECNGHKHSKLYIFVTKFSILDESKYKIITKSIKNTIVH